MRTWKQILEEEWDGIDAEWGPHSQHVWSAIECLGELRWFKNVGRHVKMAEICAVSSWRQALEIFNHSGEYDEKGFPKSIVNELWPITRDIELGPWWHAARSTAEDYYDYSPYIPKTLSSSEQELLWEHLYTFVSLLFAEIIGADRVTSTYLRQQLAWYAAGHFPCGRQPDGHLRVF